MEYIIMAESIKFEIVVDDKGSPVIRQFTKGLGDAEKGSNSFKGVLKSLGDGFESMTGMSLKAAGAIAGVGLVLVKGVKEVIDFSRAIANSNNEISRNAEILGMSATQYQQWVTLAKKGDASAEDLGTAFKLLSKNMNDSLVKGSDANKMFESMGIRTKDASGNLRSINDVATDLATKFQGSANGAEKMAAALHLMGRGGEKMIAVLNQGAGGLSTFKTVSDAAVKAGTEMEDAFKDLAGAWGKVKAELAVPLNLVVTPILNVLTEVTKALQEAVQIWGSILSNSDIRRNVLSMFGITSGISKSDAMKMWTEQKMAKPEYAETEFAAKGAAMPFGYDEAAEKRRMAQQSLDASYLSKYYASLGNEIKSLQIQRDEAIRVASSQGLNTDAITKYYEAAIQEVKDKIQMQDKSNLATYYRGIGLEIQALEIERQNALAAAKKAGLNPDIINKESDKKIADAKQAEFMTGIKPELAAMTAGDKVLSDATYGTDASRAAAAHTKGAGNILNDQVEMELKLMGKSAEQWNKDVANASKAIADQVGEEQKQAEAANTLYLARKALAEAVEAAAKAERDARDMRSAAGSDMGSGSTSLPGLNPGEVKEKRDAILEEEKKLNDEIYSKDYPMRKVIKEQQAEQKGIETMWKDTTKKMEDAFAHGFVEMVMSGFKNIGDAMKKLATKIVGIWLEMIVKMSLNSLMTGSAAGTGSGGLFGFLGQMFGGGMGTPPVSGAAASGTMNTGWGYTADGGVFDKPSARIIGEAGPEAVVPLKGGAIPVSGGGGKGNTYVFIQANDPASFHDYLRKNPSGIMAAIGDNARMGGSFKDSVRGVR